MEVSWVMEIINPFSQFGFYCSLSGGKEIIVGIGVSCFVRLRCDNIKNTLRDDFFSLLFAFIPDHLKRTVTFHHF
jgi:hypothetical protein